MFDKDLLSESSLSVRISLSYLHYLCFWVWVLNCNDFMALEMLSCLPATLTHSELSLNQEANNHDRNITVEQPEILLIIAVHKFQF